MLEGSGRDPVGDRGRALDQRQRQRQLYVVADAINSGVWGYNNLQWWGVTYYHKFNDQWHLSFETYHLYQKNVLNATDPAGIIANGG